MEIVFPCQPFSNLRFCSMLRAFPRLYKDLKPCYRNSMQPRLIQQQAQRLILSPQIRQYLKLLELPLAELEQAIDTELGENPCLEEKSSVPEDSAEAPERIHGAEELHMGENFNHLDALNDDYNNSFDSLDLSRQDAKNLQEKKNFQEGLLTKTEALSDFLLWQVRLLDFSQEEVKIAEEIIGNIDDGGYFQGVLDEIAKNLNQPASKIEEILKRIQSLDPPGIGARNLQETLILQLTKKRDDAMRLASDLCHSERSEESREILRRKTPQDDTGELELALKIVSEHLPLLEKRDWNVLARVLNVAAEQIKKASLHIARLDPKPGRSFYADNTLGAPPDASITFNDEEDEQEPFKIEIHNEALREIRLSPYYRRLIRTKGMDTKTKAFLKEKMQAAIDFLRAIDLRQSTLRAITVEIVKAQPAFLEKGFAHLKPLRLKDISATLGIHESTVSRALHGKSIVTPQGMIPYKSFFSNKMETAEGSESQKSIMEKIRHLIAAEDSAKPLSDQEIVRQLGLEGIKIARRTAAKYRDLLKILPTHLRRQR